MAPTLRKILATALLVGSAQMTWAGNITIKGSDTLVILAQKWAEVYMQKNPGTTIQVTGGGSGTGVAALQNQTTDICNSSRKMKAREIENCVRVFGKRPREYPVALDGLTVYVHADNPVAKLSVPQIGDIFAGKIRNWKELGGADAPIVLYSRENSSGTYEFFKENVLKGRDFASSAQTMPGTAAVLQAVAKDKNSIGYGGAAYGQGAKHLKVSKEPGGEAIEPNEENVVSGKYPIWRYLYNYLNPELEQGEVKAYLDWVRSEDGQKVVKDVGYYPLPTHLRKK